MSLTREVIDIVKATVPVLEEHGLTIVKRFYKNLFANHEYVHNLLEEAHVFPDTGKISPQV